MPHLNDKRLLTLCLVLSFVYLPLLHATEDTSANIAKFQQTMAARGHAASQYKLAMIYETGAGVPQDITASRIWYSRAAEQAYKPAAHRLTYLDMLQNHRGADQTWLQQLQRDANAGDGEVMLLLGQMYGGGIGLPADLKLATKYLRQARSQNIPGSETELARVESTILLQNDAAAQIKHRAATDARLIQQKADTAAAERNRAQQLQQQQKLAQAQLEQRQQALAEQQRLIQSSSTSPAKPPALADRKIITPILEEVDTSPCTGRNRFAPTCR